MFNAFLRCSECHAGQVRGVLVASSLPALEAHDVALRFKALHLANHGVRFDLEGARVIVGVSIEPADVREGAPV